MLESELEPNTLRCFHSYTDHLFTWSFIHLFYKYLLSVYDVLGSVIALGLQ